jgi:hypothetical protein
MKVAVANSIREQYVQKLMSLLSDEDLGMIASNSFNFPIVADGEESWVEIVVKIPKEDDGYDKREEYSMKLEDRKAKAEEKAKAKAKKVERDRKLREEKAKAKAEAEAKGE